MKIELLQDIELDRQNHLWYGGNVAKISYNDIDFYISANGEVSGRLFDIEKETRFTDKRRQGVLRNYLLDYGINTDEELKDAINYKLKLEDSNWWELYAVYNGEFLDLEACLPADKINDAINSALTLIPSYEGYIKSLFK